MSNYILKKNSITCSCANPHTQLLVTLRNGRLKNSFTPGREREGEKERERERERGIVGYYFSLSLTNFWASVLKMALYACMIL